jgi:hypothetical protein
VLESRRKENPRPHFKLRDLRLLSPWRVLRKRTRRFYDLSRSKSRDLGVMQGMAQRNLRRRRRRLLWGVWRSKFSWARKCRERADRKQLCRIKSSFATQRAISESLTDIVVLEDDYYWPTRTEKHALAAATGSFSFVRVENKAGLDVSNIEAVPDTPSSPRCVRTTAFTNRRTTMLIVRR